MFWKKKENATAQEPVLKDAEIIERYVTDTVGREAGLGVASRFYMVLGFVCAVASVLVALLTGDLRWLAGIPISLFTGTTLFVHFGAQAEIIRLLKKTAGMPYTGTITGTGEGSTLYICSECGALAWKDSVKCEKCKSVFVKKQDTGSGGQGSE
jgi:DNA-directed RNA polymerase subunit RPC12/RpoP